MANISTLWLFDSLWIILDWNLQCLLNNTTACLLCFGQFANSYLIQRQSRRSTNQSNDTIVNFSYPVLNKTKSLLDSGDLLYFVFEYQFQPIQYNKFEQFSKRSLILFAIAMHNAITDFTILLAIPSKSIWPYSENCKFITDCFTWLLF